MSGDLEPRRVLLYRLMAENRQHARLSEDRRILITSVTIVVASGILVALTIVPSGARTLPLALWLAALGLLATLLCLKLYERAQFHERRARQFRARLIELAGNEGIEEAQQEAEAAHRHAYPRLSSVRLNTLLVALNALVSLLGLLYLVLALAHLA